MPPRASSMLFLIIGMLVTSLLTLGDLEVFPLEVLRVSQAYRVGEGIRLFSYGRANHLGEPIGKIRETYICCFMRPPEIPELILLRSSKIPCSSTGSLANGCTYRGIIGIIPTFTGQKTYNPIP